MSCKEMDGLLARYASGDLTDEEEFIVRVHLSVCEACRESFEIYQNLESELVSRAKERPSPRSASRKIMKRLRVDEQPVFVSSLWSAPVIIGAVVAVSILLTVAFGLFTKGTSAAPQGIPGLTDWERYFMGIPDWIAGLFGSDIWLISAVYGAVAVGFVVMGSIMTLRFVRDR
jgi:anti-sigma factor RsiW